MITGIHLLLYSTDPDADRAFLLDVLRFRAVDAGGGWLIFRLPPAELGVHPQGPDPAKSQSEHDLLGTVPYLMCDDLRAEIAALTSKGVCCSDIQEESWGLTTGIRLPSGGRIGLYQPYHPVP